MADATRRVPDELWPHWLPMAPDGYRLSFDRAYGDLLAYEALCDGEAYASATVTDVTYGGPVDLGAEDGAPGRS